MSMAECTAVYLNGVPKFRYLLQFPTAVDLATRTAVGKFTRARTDDLFTHLLKLEGEYLNLGTSSKFSRMMSRMSSWLLCVLQLIPIDSSLDTDHFLVLQSTNFFNAGTTKILNL